MAKPAPAKLPFEKNAALDYDSPALSTEIYSGDQSPFHDTEMVTCPPRIICSPKRTGKTTLVHYMYHKQKNISDLLDEESCNIIFLDEIEKGASESELRQKVTTTLGSPKDCDTLVKMMELSEIINRSSKDRIILAIPDADNLSNAALRWLLYNVREIFLNPEISATLRCQIIVEGSFSLETITTVDSEFPLPQVFPRDFDEGEQHAFVRSGLSQLNALLSPDGHHALWENTRGDKYLTQAVCLNLIEGVELGVARLKFDEKDIYSSIEKFLRADPAQEPLKQDWIRSLAELSGHFETKEFELAMFLKNMRDQWGVQSENIRMLTYQGGLIRRIEPSKLETRPFVLDTFEQVKDRVMQARALIDSNFALDGVPHRKVKDAREAIRQIMHAAYFGHLRTLHVGAGIKLNDREVRVDATALGQGTYSGTWQIGTESSIKDGDPLWAILWSCEDTPGKRMGEIVTFPVQPV